MSNEPRFKDLDPSLEEKAGAIGKEIWMSLRKAFPDNTDEHLDIILNSLVYCLVIMGVNYMPQDDGELFIKLVNKIIRNNFK